MLIRTPPASMLLVLCLGLLSVALVFVLTGAFPRKRTSWRQKIIQPFKSAARLSNHLSSAAATLVVATVHGESNATPVIIAVLLEDQTQRMRMYFHTHATLARCITAIGAPPANCAVLIVHRLERDGRLLSGCVERLTCTDGTIRTLISLSIENDPGAPSADTIAARLASYYLIATGAERTVLGADPPSPLPRPAVAAATRSTPPDTIGRMTLPVVVDGKRA